MDQDTVSSCYAQALFILSWQHEEGDKNPLKTHHIEQVFFASCMAGFDIPATGVKHRLE